MPVSEDFARLTDPRSYGDFQRGHDGGYRAHSIGVLTTAASRVARVTAFNDPGLFATFRLPHTVPAALAVGAISPVPSR